MCVFVFIPYLFCLCSYLIRLLHCIKTSLKRMQTEHCLVNNVRYTDCMLHSKSTSGPGPFENICEMVAEIDGKLIHLTCTWDQIKCSHCDYRNGIRLKSSEGISCDTYFQISRTKCTFSRTFNYWKTAHKNSRHFKDTYEPYIELNVALKYNY